MESKKVSGAERLQKHMKLKSSNYETERRHFREWLTCQQVLPQPAAGWLIKGDKSTFPEFDIALLKKYGSWLLDHYRKGSLTHTQAAVNFYYAESGLPTPWVGRSFSRTSAKYMDARKELMIENGEFESGRGQLPMGCRVAVPEDTIKWLTAFGESLQPNDPRLPKVAIILIGFVFLLRASSLYFAPGDVRFIRDGDGAIATLIVESACVKTLDKAANHQMRCPAPNPGVSANHPRNRIFRLIEKALLRDEFFTLIPSPEAASDIVSKWMDDLIPAEVSSLVKGTKITSHSLRKAGASAMGSLGLDLRTIIMPWGRWRSMSSAEKYPEHGFMVSSFSGGVFSWCLPASSPFAWAED